MGVWHGASSVHIVLPLLAVALAGCASGGGSGGADPHLASGLRTARSFTGFPLYWAGMKLGRLPLTSVTKGAEHFGEAFTFIYGTCEASGDEGSCSPPVQIQVTSLCNRLPKDLGIHRLSPNRLRGALVSAAEAGADNGGDLSLYVAGATITIYGDSREIDLEAVRSLRGANRLAHAGPGGPLPAASRRQIGGAAC